MPEGCGLTNSTRTSLEMESMGQISGQVLGTPSTGGRLDRQGTEHDGNRMAAETVLTGSQSGPLCPKSTQENPGLPRAAEQF